MVVSLKQFSQRGLKYLCCTLFMRLSKIKPIQHAFNPTQVKWVLTLETPVLEWDPLETNSSSSVLYLKHDWWIHTPQFRLYVSCFVLLLTSFGKKYCRSYSQTWRVCQTPYFCTFMCQPATILSARVSRLLWGLTPRIRVKTAPWMAERQPNPNPNPRG